MPSAAKARQLGYSMPEVGYELRANGRGLREEATAAEAKKASVTVITAITHCKLMPGT